MTQNALKCQKRKRVTDHPTDRPTIRPTDIAPYRVACTRLKTPLRFTDISIAYHKLKVIMCEIFRTLSPTYVEVKGPRLQAAGVSHFI